MNRKLCERIVYQSGSGRSTRLRCLRLGRMNGKLCKRIVRQSGSSLFGKHIRIFAVIRCKSGSSRIFRLVYHKGGQRIVYIRSDRSLFFFLCGGNPFFISRQSRIVQFGSLCCRSRFWLRFRSRGRSSRSWCRRRSGRFGTCLSLLTFLFFGKVDKIVFFFGISAFSLFLCCVGFFSSCFVVCRQHFFRKCVLAVLAVDSIQKVKQIGKIPCAGLTELR